MARLLLLGSVPLDGVRPADLPRKPARHRSVPAFARAKLYHMGFRSQVARSTLADANESRDWRIYADFAQVLIRIARPLYARDPIGLDFDQSLYALDSTTIDLCLSLFPWAKFRRHKAAVKMHTLLDLRGNIPTFIRITAGKTHDVNILDEFLPEPGAYSPPAVSTAPIFGARVSLLGCSATVAPSHWLERFRTAGPSPACYPSCRTIPDGSSTPHAMRLARTGVS